MKLDANLDMLYGSLPLKDRFAAAANDGFDAVEILWPYEQPPDWYARQLTAHGLRLVLINMPKEADGTGRWGWGALPDHVDSFRRAFARAVAVCQATGCPTIHALAGALQPDLPRERHRQTFLDNLRWALDQTDRVFTLEALNHIDMPGYFYQSPQQALEIVHALDSPRVRLQFDMYHTAKQGLDVPAELDAALPWTHHVQVAGAPDRDEPDLGKHRLREAFALLAERGYSGWIGCEYCPRSANKLRWRAPLIENGWLR